MKNRFALRIRKTFFTTGIVLLATWQLACGFAIAGPFDLMPLDLAARLREAERYQMNIAEKYFREQNWPVAQSEYEKFLTLYEESEGAAYAQLKWSHCLVHQRKLNTAIKDGYQSVIDYWPDSEQAVAALYLIANSYKAMGETNPAKKTYAEVLTKHPKHLVATLSRVDLLDIARVEADTPRRVALWKELTFDTDRTDKQAAPHCAAASRELAVHYFSEGSFGEGQKALATTYDPKADPAELVRQVAAHARNPISQLTSQADTKAKGEKVADDLIVWLRDQIPTDRSDPARQELALQYWFLLADTQSVARRADKVLEVYDQMQKTFGQDDRILDRLAGWFKSQNRRDEARTTYARFKDQVQGKSQIAVMAREEKEYDRAVGIYQQLVGEDAPRAVQWNSLTATTYREAGKPDPAIAVYQQLIVADSQRANSWQWEIAVTYRQFGKLREAIAAFRLCEESPDRARLLAHCHRDLKEHKEALGLYAQMMVVHESWAPWAQLQIGYTQEEAGQSENAIKSFQQVCRRFPKSGQASEAHAHLQNKYKITATLGGATSGM